MAEADSQILRVLGKLEHVHTGWVREMTRWDQYFDGTQPISYMAADLAEDLGEQVTQLVINWPALVTETFAERLTPEGMRYPEGSPAVSGNTLWEWWQANDMDDQAAMAHLDTIALARTALIVGPGESSAPTITAESCMDVAWLRDPRTRHVETAMKRWAAEGDDGIEQQWRTLYVPGRRIVLRNDRGRWLVDSEDSSYPDLVPVVPMVNRPRLKRLDGRSEFEEIIPIADAANKMATDMMVSGEYHAMPRRWVFGLKMEDFKGKDGKLKSPWSVIKGRIWANENPDVKAGQFPESDLRNFHETIKILARLTAQLAGLPSSYMAFESVNPPSAESMRAEEQRLVKRAENKQIVFGNSYEAAMRHAIWFATGSYDPLAERMETEWREAGTPTTAQVADATVKKIQAKGADGRPLVPTEQGRIDLGYTIEQRAEMARMDREALEDPVVAAYRALSEGRTSAASNAGTV